MTKTIKEATNGKEHIFLEADKDGTYSVITAIPCGIFYQETSRKEYRSKASAAAAFRREAII